MKKFFTLIAVALVALSANAADYIQLGGQGDNGSWSWGWTEQIGANYTVSFGSDWAEFWLAKSITEGAKTYKLVVEAPNELVNLRIKNGNPEGGSDKDSYIAIASTELTGEVNAATGFEVQTSKGGESIHIISFELIDEAGNATQTEYATNWGTVNYGGIFAVSQWGEFYLHGVAGKATQNLKVEFNEAVAAGTLQLKLYTVDAHEDGKGEAYIDIPAGTEAVLAVTEECKAISLQAKDAVTVNLKGISFVTEETAIQGVTAKKVQNDAVYNLAGQKVNAQYKGVVIKNGRKVMQ